MKTSADQRTLFLSIKLVAYKVSYPQTIVSEMFYSVSASSCHQKQDHLLPYNLELGSVHSLAGRRERHPALDKKSPYNKPLSSLLVFFPDINTHEWNFNSYYLSFDSSCLTHFPMPHLLARTLYSRTSENSLQLFLDPKFTPCLNVTSNAPHMLSNHYTLSIDVSLRKL